MESTPCPACGQDIYDEEGGPDTIPCDGCGHERGFHCKSSMKAKKWFCMEDVIKNGRNTKCKCTMLK